MSRGKGPLAVRQLNVSVSHSRKERAGCPRLARWGIFERSKRVPNGSKKAIQIGAIKKVLKCEGLRRTTTNTFLVYVSTQRCRKEHKCCHLRLEMLPHNYNKH